MTEPDLDRILEQLDAACEAARAAVALDWKKFQEGHDFEDEDGVSAAGQLPLTDACEHAHVSLRTAQRYIRRGMLPVLAERPNQRGHPSKVVDADALRRLAETHKTNRTAPKQYHPTPNEFFPSSIASWGPMRRFQHECALTRVCPFSTLDLLLRGCSSDLDMLATAIRWIVSPVSLYNGSTPLLPLLYNRKVESDLGFHFERAFAQLIRKQAGTVDKSIVNADFSKHWKAARLQVALGAAGGTWSVNARPELQYDWDLRKARLQMVPTWLERLRRREDLRRSSMNFAMVSIAPCRTRGPIAKMLSAIASMVWPTSKDGKPCRDENAAERLRALMASAKYSVDSSGRFIFDGGYATKAKRELKALFYEHGDKDRYVSQVVSAIAYRYNNWRPSIKRALINRVFCMNRSNSLPRPGKPQRRVVRAPDRFSLSDEIDNLFASEQSKAPAHADY